MQSRIAFITGASRGIGLAIAEEFARAGIHLAINGRKEEPLAAVAERLSKEYHISCVPLAGDVSQYSFVEQAFFYIKEKLGKVDILVNNAGISHVGLLMDMSPEDWGRVIDVNLNSLFYCCKAALPSMLAQKAGKILNISSVWGAAGASCEVAYSASKGGVNAFTKALAKEMAPSNIQVNAIACGAMDTQMNDCFSAKELKSLEEEIPAGRLGRPEEAARLALTLTECPPYLTGQIITLDGGWI